LKNMLLEYEAWELGYKTKFREAIKNKVLNEKLLMSKVVFSG
jgi:hypothetical protein